MLKDKEGGGSDVMAHSRGHFLAKVQRKTIIG
jgi:hypothetical protein